MDENYEWDSEFPGDAELLEALHLGVAGPRPHLETEPQPGVRALRPRAPRQAPAASWCHCLSPLCLLLQVKRRRRRAASWAPALLPAPRPAALPCGRSSWPSAVAGTPPGPGSPPVDSQHPTQNRPLCCDGAKAHGPCKGGPDGRDLALAGQLPLVLWGPGTDPDGLVWAWCGMYVPALGSGAWNRGLGSAGVRVRVRVLTRARVWKRACRVGEPSYR